MLRKFAVKNFKGFKDRIELDLSNHKNYEFNVFAIKNDIIKDAIIYGPNGCGKSNLGYAIFDIVNHLSQKMKNPLPYVNAIYAGNRKALMDFEYEFVFNSQVIEYAYSKNADNVLIKEKLIVDSVIVFERDGGFSIDLNQFQMTPEVILSLQQNSNNISIINYLLSAYPLPENHYLNRLKTFVDSMLWFRCLEDRGFIGLKNQTQLLEEFIIVNGFVEDFKKFIEEVSGQSFIFKRPNKNDKALVCLIDGDEVLFHSIWSTGTSSLTLLYYWLKNIDSASFLFIDEFDAFYHFRLASAVCSRLFRLPCQVILTSHNTYLMSNDLLRPDCNFIINNNKIKALADCTDKELRWGHNIEKIYRGNGFEV